MYAEWVSAPIAVVEEQRWSVLHKLPTTSGREVVSSVVTNLSVNVGSNVALPSEPSTNLSSSKEVYWCMEVICYGLSLPLSYHEAVRDCVAIYCEWLQALTKPKPHVPKPICDDPNNYARRIISHFYNLFVPRADSNSDLISKQALLCHRVLRTLQTVAEESTLIDKETWDTLLLFLLAINNMLLSPPPLQGDDIGTHLCERILSVLVQVWIVACHRAFPSPPLWKSFRELGCTWRHRLPLVEQWNRVSLELTVKVLQILYGSEFTASYRTGEPYLIPANMSKEAIVETWFRFLHVLGNPVDLCQPELVSHYSRFDQAPAPYADSVIDPTQHPVHLTLPIIFLKAMKGVSHLVDAFLGIFPSTSSTDVGRHSFSSAAVASSSSSITPPGRRNTRPSATSFGRPSQVSQHLGSSRTSISTSSTISNAPTHSNEPLLSSSSVNALIASTKSTIFSTVPAPMQSCPTVNSILHLFGPWLFQASLLEPEPSRSRAQTEESLPGGSLPGSIEISSSLSSEQFEAGQAEAVGVLCRLFCSKKTGEEILPVYLARFYWAVHQCLQHPIKQAGQVVCSVIVHSANLLRRDLSGVNILIPSLIPALEAILPEKELSFLGVQSDNSSLDVTPRFFSQVELRHASIHLLLSMLPLPNHFRSLPIKGTSSEPTGETPVLTFQSLWPHLLKLLLGALKVETDSYNTQMLLGGLLFCVMDSSLCEEIHQESGAELALYTQASNTICTSLLHSWKSDLNVTMSALEVLTGLARIHPRIPPYQEDLSHLYSVPTVKSICELIVSQCQRPPQAHSRDLHSSIVASYHCLTTWLMEHPNLLTVPTCVSTVLEVVELGISGSKSQPSQTPQFKADKEMKPASMRVKDAAEAVLATMLQIVDHFPGPCGPDTISSLVDEVTLVRQACQDETINEDQALTHFRYFFLNHCEILALLDQPFANEEEPLPAVTMLLRGPFGRFAWAMQLRHLPRHKSGPRYCYSNPGRPLPLSNVGVTHSIRHRYFPETVEKIPLCNLDKSVPVLSSLSKDELKLASLFKDQVPYEEKVAQDAALADANREFPNPELDCTAPKPCQEFQTARLVLSHLGLISSNSKMEDIHKKLVPLNPRLDNLKEMLHSLDHLPDRTNDTVFVFYVRKGQRFADEILDNTLSSKNVSSHFLEFLLSLGWPVNVHTHQGWCGNSKLSHSFNAASSATCKEDEVTSPSSKHHHPLPSDHGGCLYNGDQQILYWADGCSELAFIVPSKPTTDDRLAKEDDAEVTIRIRTYTKPDGLISTLPPIQDAPRSAEDAKEGGTDSKTCLKFGRQSSLYFGFDMKVFVVWLERIEDHQNFPFNDLLHFTSDASSMPSRIPSCIIFIHPLLSGLFLIKLTGVISSRMTMALPLVDGMVVSRRTLGSLVRQTALNICRRRRLDTEHYQPPHVRRRLKIQEIAARFAQAEPEPDLYSSFYHPPSSI